MEFWIFSRELGDKDGRIIEIGNLVDDVGCDDEDVGLPLGKEICNQLYILSIAHILAR